MGVMMGKALYIDHEVEAIIFIKQELRHRPQKFQAWDGARRTMYTKEVGPEYVLPSV